LGGALNNLALLLRERNEMTEARRLLQEAIRHQQAALEMNPQRNSFRLLSPVFARQFLRQHYRALAVTLLRLGEHGEAAKIAEALHKAPPVWSRNDWDGDYDAACYLAR